MTTGFDLNWETGVQSLVKANLRPHDLSSNNHLTMIVTSVGMNGCADHINKKMLIDY